MPRNYDDIDLYFTRTGDFAIEAGDLRDTSEDGLRSLVQEISMVVKSTMGDWELYPGIGTGVDEFKGRANTKKTSNLIHDKIRMSLICAGICFEEDLFITMVPITRQELLVVLRIMAQPTPLNKLGNGEVLVIEMLYNFEEKGTFEGGRPWINAVVEVIGYWGSLTWGSHSWG